MESREVEEIKQHFDVIAESLRSDIKVIAEGHTVLNRKVDVLHEELNTLREENSKEHKAMIEWAKKERQKIGEENEREHERMMEENRREHQKIREENSKEHKAMIEENRKEYREILSKIELSYSELHRRVSILEK